MKTSILSIVMSIFFLSAAMAQDSSATNNKRKVQFSVVPPISTDGVEAKNNINSTSFNLIGGYSKGLEGVEFSGIFNVTEENADGFQFAGVTNVVLGNTAGFQIAGVVNATMKNVDGAQLSGAVNYVGGNVDGTQLSGNVNVCGGKMRGLQASGNFNLAKDSVKGIQVTGGINIAMKDVKGVQASGIGNLAMGDVDGVQVSGAVNIAKGTTKGTQIGLINYANGLNGIQFGLVNVVDSIEKGIPIGLLSIVKNGYHRFEFEGSRNKFGAVTFKTGVKNFYNMVSFATNYGGKVYYFGLGYGVGTYIKLGTRTGINLDVTAYQLKDNNFDRFEFRHLDRLKANVNFRIGKQLEIFAGPNLNILTFESELNTRNEFTNHFDANESIYEYNGDQISVHIYPGVDFGFRF